MSRVGIQILYLANSRLCLLFGGNKKNPPDKSGFFFVKLADGVFRRGIRGHRNHLLQKLFVYDILFLSAISEKNNNENKS